MATLSCHSWNEGRWRFAYQHTEALPRVGTGEKKEKPAPTGKDIRKAIAKAQRESDRNKGEGPINVLPPPRNVLGPEGEQLHDRAMRTVLAERLRSGFARARETWSKFQESGAGGAVKHQVINAYFLYGTLKGGAATRAQIPALRKTIEELRTSHDPNTTAEERQELIHHLDMLCRISTLHLGSAAGWATDMTKGGLEGLLHLPQVGRALEMRPRLEAKIHGKEFAKYSRYASKGLMGIATILTLVAQHEQGTLEREELGIRSRKLNEELATLGKELESNTQLKAEYLRDMALVLDEMKQTYGTQAIEGIACLVGLGLLALPLWINLPVMIGMHYMVGLHKEAQAYRNRQMSSFVRLSHDDASRLVKDLITASSGAPDPVTRLLFPHTGLEGAKPLSFVGVDYTIGKSGKYDQRGEKWHQENERAYREKLLQALVYQDLKATLYGKTNLSSETENATKLPLTVAFPAIWKQVLTILDRQGPRNRFDQPTGERDFRFDQAWQITSLISEARQAFLDAKDTETAAPYYRKAYFLQKFGKPVDEWNPDPEDYGEMTEQNVVAMRMENGRPRYHRLRVDTASPGDGSITEVAPIGKLSDARKNHAWRDVVRLDQPALALMEERDFIAFETRLSQAKPKGWKYVESSIPSRQQWDEALRRNQPYIDLYASTDLPNGAKLYQKVYLSPDGSRQDGRQFVMPGAEDGAWIAFDQNRDEKQPFFQEGHFPQVKREMVAGKDAFVVGIPDRSKGVAFGFKEYAIEPSPDGRLPKWYEVGVDHGELHPLERLPSKQSFARLQELAKAMQGVPDVFPKSRISLIPSKPDGSDWYNLVFSATIDGISNDYKVYRRWNDTSERISLIRLKDTSRTNGETVGIASEYKNVDELLKGFQPERSAAHYSSQHEGQPEDIAALNNASSAPVAPRKISTKPKIRKRLPDDPMERLRKVEEMKRTSEWLFRGGRNPKDDGPQLLGRP